MNTQNSANSKAAPTVDLSTITKAAWHVTDDCNFADSIAFEIKDEPGAVVACIPSFHDDEEASADGEPDATSALLAAAVISLPNMLKLLQRLAGGESTYAVADASVILTQIETDAARVLEDYSSARALRRAARAQRRQGRR